MVFAPDTEIALRAVVNLINTAANGRESLATVADLDHFLQSEGFSGARARDAAELSSVHELRGRLAALWTADEDSAVAGVNRLLREANALPQLMKHDEWDWHLHATARDAPLAERMGTEAAMALADVIRSKEMDRMLVCEAEDCDAVVLDLSRNRSKRYCDTGNCANRAHVAAYRARQAIVR
ncbi:CGNR zinc finger domain-containing protein [Pseudarthrobacter raffinosi]|uniref:CGNR zinc finger domain-containing protein n=1 Tax=Pseudarthrobacter raffinosi TaxID=2953651 RepID=UPI00208F6353|nr:MULTISPECIES: CGNR zinc finger domain-containing protein [unclassified Pseudarthrobacter]MCO4237375.1 CGNR zinc finger domain-containing protein [Pseudarthrobacter sp. MDT3-28]MCO4253055.1 CGNR zinc finger domain-containing protein [Pseudarthrobacter sp. MDT3-9]MCO4264026.1 CGNR zinc finger domain-containing protein [Pseudarthrobacter sp. MDT3-26]